MRWRIVAGLAVALCATAGFAEGALAFSASFSWRGIPACSGTSPAFTLSKVPSGTTRLRFAMQDYDAPNFNHGGSTIPYDGKGRVPQGAVGYVGPCPPGGQVHRYVWTIEALNASGAVLARTQAQGRFPP